MALLQHGGAGHIAPPYTPGYEVVTFVWSNEHGHCYDCGLPAHFFLPRAYVSEHSPDDEPATRNLRCGICAANAATDGETVRRIEES